MKGALALAAIVLLGYALPEGVCFHGSGEHYVLSIAQFEVRDSYAMITS